MRPRGSTNYESIEVWTDTNSNVLWLHKFQSLAKYKSLAFVHQGDCPNLDGLCGKNLISNGSN